MTTIAETDRLILRTWDADELPVLQSILADPTTMVHWPAPLTQDYIQSWHDWARERSGQGLHARWAVVLKSDGSVIGDCGLVPTQIEGEDVTDLGYIFHADHWGQGYAPEAAAAALDLGLNRYKLTNIVCHMAEDHIASQRVAEKIGMTRDGGFKNPRNLEKWHLIYRPA